jgi:succinate dehydrogenase/fumarate reductase flavoprotein subunit
MWRQVGLLRSEETLRDALSQIEAIQNEVCQMPGCPAVWELTNMTQLARLIALSALLRTESRGAHRRSDYPDTDNKRWRKHIILERRLIDEIWIDDEPEISLEDVR